MEIAVNLKNPAQFFAAAGIAHLCEVTSRFVIREYEGEPDYRATFVFSGFDTRTLLTAVKAATYEEQSEAHDATYSHDDDYSHPVLMKLPNKTIELDWWLNEFWSNKSRLKTWAGTTTPVSMLHRLSEMIDPKADDILNCGVLTPGSSRPTWGFDPRVTKNTGVPGRLAKIKIYPVTELLCAVGLQYFQPQRGPSEEISFSVWQDELPVEVALVAGELEGVRTLALTARREKRSKGIFNYSSAEFIANRTGFRTTGTFAKNPG